jgi:hypothetical protein
MFRVDKLSGFLPDVFGYDRSLAILEIQEDTSKYRFERNAIVFNLYHAVMEDGGLVSNFHDRCLECDDFSFHDLGFEITLGSHNRKRQSPPASDVAGTKPQSCLEGAHSIADSLEIARYVHVSEMIAIRWIDNGPKGLNKLHALSLLGLLIAAANHGMRSV